MLVHHYMRALPHAFDKALAYARAAAEESVRMLAYSEAARLYETALSALNQSPASDQKLRCELLLALGEAQCRSDFAGFRDTFREAAQIARTLNDSESLARAALGYGMLGNPLSAGLSDPDPITSALLEEALESLQPPDHPMRARLLARLAEEVATRLPPETVAQLVDRAIAVAQASGDCEGQAAALFIKYRALLRGPDHYQESKASLEEILAIAERNRMRHWHSRLHYHLGSLALQAGDVRAMHHQIAMLKAIPDPLQLGSHGRIDSEITLIVDALCALIEGRFDNAVKASIEALTLGRRRRHREADAFFGLQMFCIMRERGQVADTIETTRHNLENDPQNSLLRSILGFSYAQIGQLDNARIEFSRLAADRFRSVRRDFTWFAAMAFNVETCCAIEDRANASVLADLLAPMSEHNAVIGFCCYLGPFAYYLGKLSSTLENFDEAIGRFEDAIEMATRLSSVGWAARAQLSLAQALLQRNTKADALKARELLEIGRATAATLGATELVDIAALLAARLRSEPAFDATVQDEVSNLFHREDDFWTVTFGGKTVRLRQAKGLTYISHLVANPGQEIHVLKLEALAHGEPVAGSGEVAAVESASDAGEVLDTKAVNEYRRRAKEIAEELEEARDHNDLGRVEMLSTELGSIEHELRTASGLGRRTRKVGSNVERARVRIKNSISASLLRLREAHPELARHFDRTLKTGEFCSYEPGSGESGKWVV